MTGSKFLPEKVESADRSIGGREVTETLADERQPDFEVAPGKYASVQHTQTTFRGCAGCLPDRVGTRSRVLEHPEGDVIQYFISHSLQ